MKRTSFALSPRARKPHTDDITYCSRAPEHMTDGREVKGPVVAPRSLDRRAIEGPVDAGPGIKGVIVSKDLYIVPADWSYLEHAPEDAKVEVTIDLDLK